MTSILAAAAEVQRFCAQHGWRFCFIGGLAVQRWSQPRFTHDADLTLLTGIGEEERYIDPLLEQFQGRFDNEREQAILRRVLFLTTSSGIPIDIALGALDFEIHSVERATPWSVPRAPEAIVTCSAEDLLVHKALADRDIDWIDAQGIVVRQGRKLNIEQIWTELRPLVALKEEPQILDRLQKLFDQHLD